MFNQNDANVDHTLRVRNDRRPERADNIDASNYILANKIRPTFSQNRVHDAIFARSATSNRIWKKMQRIIRHPRISKRCCKTDYRPKNAKNYSWYNRLHIRLAAQKISIQNILIRGLHMVRRLSLRESSATSAERKAGSGEPFAESSFYPYERTSSDRVDWSVSCHELKERAPAALLRIPTQIDRLTLSKGRDIHNEVRHLFAAIRRWLPLQCTRYAVLNLFFQSDHFILPDLESRVNRRSVRQAGNSLPFCRFA